MVVGYVGVVLCVLVKVVLGGELVCILLVILVIVLVVIMVLILIFDEVDSGIGGVVVEVVGWFLKCFG